MHESFSHDRKWNTIPAVEDPSVTIDLVLLPMLDFVTRRRLIIFLCAIAFVTLSIAFFGRLIPSYYTHPSIKPEDRQPTNRCDLTEPFDRLSLCQKCTSYESRSKVDTCLPTGYRETVLCSKTNVQTTRPCDVPVHIQTQRFWLFESVMVVVGLLAIASVQSRQKTLERQMVEKIRRQIGADDE